MLTHALLAAGRGTRMFGQGGGNKALSRLGQGYLVDYVVRELTLCSPDLTRLLVPIDDQGISQRVSELSDSRIEVISSPPLGTGRAVRQLLANGLAGDIALTTCDLIATPGAIARFVGEARTLLHVQVTPMAKCIIAVSKRDPLDPLPIFVHTDGSIVLEYGKRIRQSDWVFSGARVMNEEFASWICGVPDEDLSDTQLMAAAVKEMPGAVLSLRVESLFDVDDSRSLLLAEKLTKGDQVG